MIDKFRALNPQSKKTIVACAAVSVVLFLGWKGLVQKDLQTLKSLKQAVSENTQKSAKFEDNAALKKKLNHYEAFLSKNRQVDWLIETVNRLAAESGLALLSASPQATREDSDYPKLVLLVEAEGGYHELGRFVEKLENNRPLVLINSLRVGPSDMFTTGKLKTTLTLGAFYSAGAAS